eukprot:TRINITY_DN10931_c0_g1_i13.p1 TRINITY_DN10931_c0_g1~~TRINITY_DN10931_c0_g1_i13.p1  ORF type:complete len:351 (-),score=53.17 TRINITY_DN10931_c0_g1_i13:465-1517(-)
MCIRDRSTWGGVPMQKVNKENKSLNVIHKFRKDSPHLLTGAISGAISRSVTSPFERVIILKQTGNPVYKGQGVFAMIVSMAKREGLHSWYKGNGVNVARIAPFTAVEFFSFEIYKETLASIYDNARGGRVQATLSTPEYLLCGALAGMTSSTMTYPFDLLRTIFAVQTDGRPNKGIVRTLMSVVNEKGILGLYKGWLPTMMGIAPYCGLKLGMFQTIKDLFYGKDLNNRRMSDAANLVFGGISGCFAMTMTYPSDLVRRRFQVKILSKSQEAKSILSEFKAVVQESGYRGLYSGIGATYCKVIPAVALTFAINERLKRMLNVHQNSFGQNPASNQRKSMLQSRESMWIQL